MFTVKGPLWCFPLARKRKYLLLRRLIGRDLTKLKGEEKWQERWSEVSEPFFNCTSSPFCASWCQSVMQIVSFELFHAMVMKNFLFFGHSFIKSHYALSSHKLSLPTLLPHLSPKQQSYTPPTQQSHTTYLSPKTQFYTQPTPHQINSHTHLTHTYPSPNQQFQKLFQQSFLRPPPTFHHLHNNTPPSHRPGVFGADESWWVLVKWCQG